MKWALIMVLALAGCSPAHDVERDVAAVLKDPASAQFGETTVRGDGISRIACGTVNSKNSFGGYTGAQPFMAKGGLLYMGVSPTCCKLHLVETVGEGAAQALAECKAKLPEPLLIDQ